jgi:1,4-alpha-glucan branching enzyme
MRAVLHHAREGGAERGWGLERGASVIDDGVRFEVWAPHARRVTVEASAGARFIELEPATCERLRAFVSQDA